MQTGGLQDRSNLTKKNSVQTGGLQDRSFKVTLERVNIKVPISHLLESFKYMYTLGRVLQHVIMTSPAQG